MMTSHHSSNPAVGEGIRSWPPRHVHAHPPLSFVSCGAPVAQIIFSLAGDEHLPANNRLLTFS
jgi:hypothetical protein